MRAVYKKKVDKMDLNTFSEDWEEPIHQSLEEVFDHAELNHPERNIFYKYRSDCEYWLLRSKLFYSKSLDDKPNFIQNLARVLINLQLQKVTGTKDHLVKEMFSNKKIHRSYKTQNGVRATKFSDKLENTYFELEIMSFLLKNGFSIELSKSKKGQKIPEFIAIKNFIKINVEAKSLNRDKIEDNIFGDTFVTGINYRRTEEEKKKGYDRISSTVENNYLKAMGKFSVIPKNEYFILFLSAYYNIRLMGQPAINYLNVLPNQWQARDFNNFIGIILPDSKTTYFLKNEKCDLILLNHIPDLLEYHSYSPTIIEK